MRGDAPCYYSSQMAARMLGVDNAMICRMIQQGRLGKTIQQNGRVYVSERMISIRARRPILIHDPEDDKEKLCP
jgi:predicted site-specific integrase-resolvase